MCLGISEAVRLCLWAEASTLALVVPLHGSIPATDVAAEFFEFIVFCSLERDAGSFTAPARRIASLVDSIELDHIGWHHLAVTISVVESERVERHIEVEVVGKQVEPHAHHRLVDEDSVIDDPSGC